MARHPGRAGLRGVLRAVLPATARVLPAALTLLLVACSAQGPSPDAMHPETEAGYLRSYALLVCIGAAYERLEPPAPGVVALLQGEAWVFVEKGRVGAHAYERLYPLARAAGGAIPPEAAVRGCLQWHRGEALRQAIAAVLAQAP